jgi:type I restriction enzyme S subunit
MSAGFKYLDLAALPDDWTADHFGNLIDYNLGRTPPRNSPKYWQGGIYPWASISDMTPYGVIKETAEKVSQQAFDDVFRGRLAPEGSLLMSFKLTIGRISRLGVPAFHNEAIISFQPDQDKISPEYLGYYLSQISYKDYQDTAIKGQTLNKGKLDSLEIALPPLPEQQAIAHTLNIVQQAINAQERIIKTTTELKKALMQKLFSEGLRGEPQKETEIGLVPVSWEVCTIGDVAVIQSGGTPSREALENWKGGTIPWVKTGEINYCAITDTEEKITPLGLANSSARIFPKGTLLMAMYGQGITRGRVGLLGIEAATNQACAAIIPLDPAKTLTQFLYYFFEYSYERLRQLGHGANQKNMSATLIRSFPLTLPSPNEQEEIAAALRVLDQKLTRHHKKLISNCALFRTLLHDLMTAKARVNNAALAL